MKHAIHIKPNTYPIKFVVLLGYGDRHKADIMREIRGASATSVKHLKREIRATALDLSYGWTFISGGLIVIILPKWKNATEFYAVIHHEICHAVFAAGKRCAFRLSEESEEFYCYMTQYLTTAVYRRLWA